MRLVILGFLALLAAAWFFLSFIHSAWMSATPIPDPERYERDALIYLLATTVCFFSGLGALIAAWLTHRKRSLPR